ncbi:hypothetical protein V3W47_07015 [Deinococcus sp. YIM 134068]|uniref:hypothetical protein n=1 Tax=Deinococcus lichenicola TaxID=3118910 RepID=UPI002F926622
MKLFRVPALIGAVFLLHSCSLPSSPGISIGTIDFRTAASMGEITVVGGVAIISDYVPGSLVSQVKHTRFLVGDSTVEGTARAEPLGTVSFWETSNSCRDLPQGVNIPVSCEMLGADGTVLKTASGVVPRVRTCP